MPFNMFPYTDLSDLNLDWLLRTVKKLEGSIATPDAISTIQRELDSILALMDARKTQNHNRYAGNARYPLTLNTTLCEYNKKAGSYLWTYSNYKPRMLHSWPRRTMHIVANVKMKAAIDATDPDNKYVVLFTGLPTVFSRVRLYNMFKFYRSDGTVIIHDGRYETEGFTRVSNEFNLPANPTSGDTCYVNSTGEWFTYDGVEWLRKYTPAGVLKLYIPDYKQDAAYSIASGDILEVSQQEISLANQWGAVVFPVLNQTDISRACSWIRAHRGLYDYSNNSYRRKNEVIVDPNNQQYGATDCAGIVYQAFRYGAGKPIPAGSKSIFGYGRIVQIARAGEEIDMSKVQEGDVMAFIYAGVGNTKSSAGECHHVAIAIRGMNEDPDDQELRFWQMSTSYGCYTRKALPGEYKDDDVIPSYQQFIHTSVVTPTRIENGVSVPNDVVFGPQPIAGTYRGTGNTYTDGDYLKSQCRIVVRLSEETTPLREPTYISDVLEDFDPGGEEDYDQGGGSDE